MITYIHLRGYYVTHHHVCRYLVEVFPLLIVVIHVILFIYYITYTQISFRASARTCSRVCVCSHAYLYIVMYTYSVSTIPRIRSYAHFPPVSHGTAFLPLLPSLAQALFHVYCVSTVCRIVPSCYFGRLHTFVAVIQPRFYARRIHFGTYIYLSAYFNRLHVTRPIRRLLILPRKILPYVVLPNLRNL